MGCIINLQQPGVTMKYLVLAAALISTNVSAQGQQCGNTDAVFKELAEKFKESMIFIGKHERNPDHVVSIWFNQANGTATVIKSSVRENKSCIVDALLESKFVSNL
jgi:hypothetical protein